MDSLGQGERFMPHSLLEEQDRDEPGGESGEGASDGAEMEAGGS